MSGIGIYNQLQFLQKSVNLLGSGPSTGDKVLGFFDLVLDARMPEDPIEELDGITSTITWADNVPDPLEELDGITSTFTARVDPQAVTVLDGLTTSVVVS